MIEFNTPDELEIISDDNFAISGMANLLKENSSIHSIECNSCILLITYHSLVDSFNFLKRNSHVFSKHNLVIIIAHQPVRKLIEGLCNVMCVFINLTENPIEILKAIDEESSCLKSLNSEGAAENFTRFQNRILHLLLKGVRPSRIANIMGVNEKTISIQKRNVMKKYGVHSTVELAMKCWLRKEFVKKRA